MAHDKGRSIAPKKTGQPEGQPTNVPRRQLVNVERGQHSLAVDILSGTKVVQSSAAVSFTVQRVNTSSPALRPPAPTPRPAN